MGDSVAYICEMVRRYEWHVQEVSIERTIGRHGDDQADTEGTRDATGNTQTASGGVAGTD